MVALGLGCVGSLLTFHCWLLWVDTTTVDFLHLVRTHVPAAVRGPITALRAAAADHKRRPRMQRFKLMLQHDRHGRRRALWRFVVPFGL